MRKYTVNDDVSITSYQSCVRTTMERQRNLNHIVSQDIVNELTQYSKTEKLPKKSSREKSDKKYSHFQMIRKRNQILPNYLFIHSCKFFYKLDQDSPPPPVKEETLNGEVSHIAMKPFLSQERQEDLAYARKSPRLNKHKIGKININDIERVILRTPKTTCCGAKPNFDPFQHKLKSEQHLHKETQLTLQHLPSKQPYFFSIGTEKKTQYKEEKYHGSSYRKHLNLQTWTCKQRFKVKILACIDFKIGQANNKPMFVELKINP